jgi:hypothetical protein
MTPGIAIATYLVLAVTLFGLFAGSARTLDGGTRERMRRWIFREGGGVDEQTRDREWAEGFLYWFDQAFRVRVRRLPLLGEVALPSVGRSVLVSFLSLLVLAVVWLSNKQGMGRAMDHGEMTPEMWEMVWRLLFVYGGATLITNWIPDYLSLVESRYIIGKMAGASSWPRRIGYLVLDACATLAISFLAIHMGMVLLLPVVSPVMELEVGCLTPASYSIDTAVELFVAGLRFDSPAGTINYDATGIYIYSTFLTSLWVWLYLGGGFVLRALVALRGARPKTSAVGRHPLRAMGLLLLALFSAVFWPSWAYRRAHSADVYIEHVAADTSAARELAALLEAEGLRVRISADTSDALGEELLREADAVVLLDSPAAEDALEPLAAELYMMGECGERAWGSSARVVLGAADSLWWHQHTDRYGHRFAWQPGSDAAAIVNWTQRTDALLHPGQIRACQAVGTDRPPAPASCELVQF